MTRTRAGGISLQQVGYDLELPALQRHPNVRLTTAGLESAFERGHHGLLFEAPLAHVLRGPDEESGPGLLSLVGLDEEPAAVREQPRQRPVGVGVSRDR